MKHTDERTTISYFEPFRVLLFHDEKSKFFVAHCLETGNVVTADDPEILKEMIKELLEDEISYAIVHNNPKNLFSSPAPFEIRTRWLKAAEKTAPDILTLDISARELRLDDSDMRPTQVRIANAAA